MFNVKRNGASVEITDIPQSIPFSVFKDIADETGATETLVAYVKDKDFYEVVIRHDSVNMAAAAAWLTLEAREPEAEDVDISTIGKRIGVMRVKQHMNTQELEEAIGASEGSVFRWEAGKTMPTNHYINCLADVLKCDPQWLQGESSEHKNLLSKEIPEIPGYLIDASANALGVLMNEYKIKEREPAIELALVVRSAFTALIT